MRRRGFVGAVVAGASSLACATRRVSGGPGALAVPSPQQLAWQRLEMGVFVHFGVNTYTDREWGTGAEEPRIFDPARLDARQWARAARAGGFRYMVLTAKHHDGFCLWPTRTTAHSVRSSPWRGGGGDVVREFADAARAEGLGVGLYLSPWDRNAPLYGSGQGYNDFYVAQLTELLTGYGPLVELWFDGANGEGPNGRRQTYDWPRIHATVRRLQPGALMFSDAGPDIRWIGNERGTAGEPNWCAVHPALVPVPGLDEPGITEALQHGNPDGTAWRPAEAPVSIRPGWFWHEREDARVRAVDDLLALYHGCVGRNANLLLNVPPGRDGLFGATDAARLAALGERIRALYGRDLAAGAAPRHTGIGAELELPGPVTVERVALAEDLSRGQAVARFRVEAESGGRWITLASGQTIGRLRLEPVSATRTARVRVVVEEALGPARIAAVRLYGPA